MTSRKGRANWCCPQCNSSDVFHQSARKYQCDACGEVVHEAVGEIGDDLHDLAGRNDSVGKIADRLLETGGVVQE